MRNIASRIRVIDWVRKPMLAAELPPEPAALAAVEAGSLALNPIAAA